MKPAGIILPHGSPMLLLALLLAAPTDNDWPTLLGPGGAGISTETILKPWPKAGLQKLWEVPLGSGYAPPTVLAERLFVADMTEKAARLRCLEAASGKQLWAAELPTDYADSYGYDPGPRAAPVCGNGRVFLHGVDGQLSAWDAATGKKLWLVDTKANYHFHQNFFGVGGAPLLVNDLLIVPVGGSPKGPRPADFTEVKPDGTALVAFDVATGVEKWRCGDDLASYSSPVLRTLGGKPTVLYFGRGGLTLAEPATGKLISFTPYRSKLLESVNAANPVVVGDKILLSECYENGSALSQFAADKLTPIWADADRDRGDKSLQAHWCTPVAVGGFLYGCHGRNPTDAELRCVDFNTGEMKWRERRTTRCTVIAIDNHLLSLGEQGELRLIKLDATKYIEVARWDVPGLAYPAWAPPAVSRGRLFLRGQSADAPREQRLICFSTLVGAK